MATSTPTRQRDQHDPGRVLEVRNPATGAAVETVPQLDAAAVGALVARARRHPRTSKLVADLYGRAIDLPPLPRLARPGLPAVPTPSRVVRGLRRVLRGGG